ncbi:MAG TPA: hypothetical protein VKS81_07715, partial [Bacteroidota bacterium]|nr:hypothetical protein [Bacteroidota bacterium]
MIFLPPGHNFESLRAEVQEARVGIFKITTNSQMRIDLGNTIDLVEYDIPASNLRLTSGIDFMSYSVSNGAEGFRLQIDALDGFFGGDVSLSPLNGASGLEARFRVMHQSAHLVDGDYSYNTNYWLAPHGQVPYTRDYGDLVVAERSENDGVNLRYYGGISHAVFVRPAEILRTWFLGGF